MESSTERNFAFKVELFVNNNDCVAKGMVTTLGIGKMLAKTRLHSSEVGVHVTTVHKSSAPIVEPFMHNLGESLHPT